MVLDNRKQEGSADSTDHKEFFVCSAPQLSDRTVHHVGSQHILAAADYLRPLVKQVVIKEQDEARLRNDTHLAEVRFAPGEAAIQIHHDRQKALIAVLSSEGAIRMRSEAFAGIISIESKSFVESDRLSSFEKPRDL